VGVDEEADRLAFLLGFINRGPPIRGREGGREGEREGGREGKKEGRRGGATEEGGGRDLEREGRREGVRERGREGGREGGQQVQRSTSLLHSLISTAIICGPLLLRFLPPSLPLPYTPSSSSFSFSSPSSPSSPLPASQERSHRLDVWEPALLHRREGGRESGGEEAPNMARLAPLVLSLAVSGFPRMR